RWAKREQGCHLRDAPTRADGHRDQVPGRTDAGDEPFPRPPPPRRRARGPHPRRGERARAGDPAHPAPEAPSLPPCPGARPRGQARAGREEGDAPGTRPGRLSAGSDRRRESPVGYVERAPIAGGDGDRLRLDAGEHEVHEELRRRDLALVEVVLLALILIDGAALRFGDDGMPCRIRSDAPGPARRYAPGHVLCETPI